MPRVPKHIPNPNPDFLSYADAYEGGINDPEVSLVASVEFDAWIRDFPEDWKWGYVRSMQVVQWTIMVGPNASITEYLLIDNGHRQSLITPYCSTP